MPYPLTLAANFAGWKLFSARKMDPAFQRFSEKVFQRDNYICQFCSFQAREYQDIVNLDGNYRVTKLDNAVTACCFCSQCNFLESVGVGSFGGGTLIYAPELDQATLNSLCHVLFCAMASDSIYKSTAEALYRSLKFRAQPVEEQFGEGCSEPHILGQLILETQVENPALNKALSDQLRLLPSRARFKTQIDSWAASALKELSLDS